MKHTELKEIQDRIKFDALSMAACVGVDYQTFRHMLYGHTKIPEAVARAAKELEQVNKTYMTERYSPGGTFDRELDRSYPNGIMSEVFE